MKMTLDMLIRSLAQIGEIKENELGKRLMLEHAYEIGFREGIETVLKLKEKHES